ncbi:MAG: MFS transporter, partial [Negativicutes bacterium]|nr:MFS transporter [Negativicutes bacterium]
MDAAFSFKSKNFLYIFAANFLYFGSFYLLLPTMPQYVDRLGGTPRQIGLVMGFFTLAAVLVRPLFGQLADRHGRKLVMLLGAGAFALIFAVYMLVVSVELLYVIRVVHGLAHAAFLAASAAYIADMAPPQRRGEVLGFYGTSNVVAMALFPAFGTFIIQSADNFAVLLSVSTLVAGAAFLLIAGLAEIGGGRAAGAKTASLLAIGKRKEVLVPSLALFAGATLYGATMTFLPVFAPQRGMANFGVFFTVLAVFTLLSRVLIGKLSDRLGRYRTILPFMALVAIAGFMLPWLTSWWMLITIGACFGLGFGAFMPTLNALVVDKTPPPERGSALGFFTSFMDLGITAGSVVLGAVSEFCGYGPMFNLGGAIMLAGLALFA